MTQGAHWTVFITGRRWHPGGTLTHIPLAEIGRVPSPSCTTSCASSTSASSRTCTSAGTPEPRARDEGSLACVGGGDQRGGGGRAVGGGRVVALVPGSRRRRGLAVHLHVFPEGGRVCVGLVAAPHLAVVGLVGGVDVRVFFPVRGVGEPSVAAFVLAPERLLTWKRILELVYWVKIT